MTVWSSGYYQQSFGRLLVVANFMMESARSVLCQGAVHCACALSIYIHVYMYKYIDTGISLFLLTLVNRSFIRLPYNNTIL